MQIYNIKPHGHYTKLFGAVIALGSFDGVHRGHQKILQTARILAKKYNKPYGVITYQPIPQVLLHKDFHFLLATDKEKVKIFRDLSVGFLGLIKFTKQIMNLEAQDYILQYIVKPIRPSAVVVGVDHHFGKAHKGNVALLKKFGKEFNFEVKVVSSLKYHGAPIKSTRIRELIILGHIKRANELLDRKYSMTGKVIKGKGLARQLGFPTLNLHMPDKAKLVPADGVHQVKVNFEGKQYDGVMNIGFAPTITNSLQAYQMRSLEVHLFGYQGNEQTSLNKLITVEFFERLRPEKRFDNLEALKKQIADDIMQIKQKILPARS
ncbi:MAG: bifunctional riboflavin kinase/FAD synthetase [Candidatus Latescibacteria bacterium]|nr:bifunctional riboflavin kinase/FAD synthetase [Candidatus Latescibacterota bacterium]